MISVGIILRWLENSVIKSHSSNFHSFHSDSSQFQSKLVLTKLHIPPIVFSRQSQLLMRSSNCPFLPFLQMPWRTTMAPWWRLGQHSSRASRKRFAWPGKTSNIWPCFRSTCWWVFNTGGWERLIVIVNYEFKPEIIDCGDFRRGFKPEFTSWKTVFLCCCLFFCYFCLKNSYCNFLLWIMNSNFINWYIHLKAWEPLTPKLTHRSWEAILAKTKAMILIAVCRTRHHPLIPTWDCASCTEHLHTCSERWWHDGRVSIQLSKPFLARILPQTSCSVQSWAH